MSGTFNWFDKIASYPFVNICIEPTEETMLPTLTADVRCTTCFITSRVGRFLLYVFFGSSCLASANVFAAPVTLQFQATVGPPRQGDSDFVPPEWGFTLSPGDTVSGAFTFEPLDVPTNVHTTSVVESMQLSLHIKSQTVTTSQFGIDVNDDSNPIDSNGPYDQIFFGCSIGANGTSCSPSNVPLGGSLMLAMQTWMYAPPSTLAGADIPSDANVWRQFTADNTMLVSMIDTANSRYYGFLATVSSFQAVPEPNALFSFAFSGIFTSFIRRTRTHGRNTQDLGDYVIWRDTQGSTTDLRADGDENGIVNAADYDIYRTHYGSTLSLLGMS